MNRSLPSTVLLIGALCGTAAFGPACDKKNGESAEEKGAALPELQPLWIPGREATFEFDLSTSTSLGALPSTSELALTGQLNIRVLQGEGSHLVLTVDPDGVKLTKPKGAQADPVELLLRELEQPFALELKAGALTAYFDPADSSMLAFGLRRQLAVVLQRAEPAQAKDRSADGSWQAAEWDASGRATVRYAPEPTDASAFVWTKSSYEQVLAVRGAHAALPEQSWRPEIVKSQGLVHVDEKGLSKIKRAEVLQTPLTKDQKLRSQYDLTLIRVGSVVQIPPRPVKQAELAGLVRRLPSDSPPAMSTESLDAIRFAGRSFDEVLDLVRAQPEEPTGKTPSDRAAFRQRQMGFNAMVGLFRMDEANVDRALVLIRKQDKTSSTLLRALAAASTPYSLASLVRLALDADTRKADRQRAAATLLRAERPNPELETSLEEFLGDPLLREHGLLGLGTFSRRWRIAGHDAAASAAVARLSTELSVAKNPDERVTCLLAVANSGDATLFDEAVAHQGSDDAKVRDAAIQAIRLMDDARVERKLTETLEGATTPRLASSVLTALAHREDVAESTVLLVEKQTEPSVDAATRRLAVLALAEWVEDWPRLTKTLERIAREDEDERVREAARSHNGT